MLEKELANFDYSTIHPIKETILKNLLKIQSETKAKPYISRSMSLKRVDLDNLNYVAADGDASIERNRRFFGLNSKPYKRNFTTRKTDVER